MKRCVASLMLILCFLPCAESVVGRKLSLSSLAKSRDLVGIGRVLDLRSFFADGQIWPLATVVLEESIKGEKKSSVRLRLPGGQQKINGRTRVTRVEGTPVLNLNE